MSSKVRVGIVGTSGWADFMYLPALQSHPQAEITAICGRNRNSAEQMAAKYNIPKVFTNYKDMINLGGLDAAMNSHRSAKWISVEDPVQQAG